MNIKELNNLKNRILENITVPKQKDTKTILFERIGVQGALINESNYLNFIRESKTFEDKLNILESFNIDEDFEEEFPDATANCLNPYKVVEWLNDEMNRIIQNKGLKIKDRIAPPDEKLVDPLNPEVHNLKLGRPGQPEYKDNWRGIRDEVTGDVNIDMFITNLRIKPSSIFKQNPKMEKSGKKTDKFVVDTGLPALVGIVYDEKDKHFYAVSTCPGAGPCKIGCFARKGFYELSYDKVMLYTRRLNLLMNHPEEYKQMAKNELLKIIKREGISKESGKQLVMRWNDAGDFFSERYFRIAVEITKELLEEGYNVKSYAYSKRSEYVIDADKMGNFTINFSTDAAPEEVENIKNYENYKNIKMGTRVFERYFDKDIYKKKPDKSKNEKRSGKYVVFTGDSNTPGSPLPVFLDAGAPDRLKDKIFALYGNKYDFDRDSLRFTWELPDEDLEENFRKFNVIVQPKGDNDDAAERDDVRMTFNLEH
jgi:hypothetical protein